MRAYALEQVLKLVGTVAVKCGQGQYDEPHEIVDCSAKEQAADDPTLFQVGQAAACSVVDCGGGQGDEVVQRDAQDVGSRSATERLSSQQATSNYERNIPTKIDACLQKIKGAGDEPSDADSYHGPSVFQCIGCKGVDQSSPHSVFLDGFRLAEISAGGTRADSSGMDRKKS